MMLEVDTIITDHNTKSWRVVDVYHAAEEDLPDNVAARNDVKSVGGKPGQIFVITVVPGP